MVFSAVPCGDDTGSGAAMGRASFSCAEASALPSLMRVCRRRRRGTVGGGF
jgi:hypothetical protein